MGMQRRTPALDETASAVPCGALGRVLLVGGSGFIGSRLSQQLLLRGHEVICASRRPQRSTHPRLHALAVDVARMSAADWREPLRGVGAVVNLVGVFRESPQGSFEALHVRGATALFDACGEAGVARVVQLSALGADEGAKTAFLRSKRRADAHLLRLAADRALDAAIVQPSLVFAPHGASASLFLCLASLPLLPLPGGGVQRVQPVHLDDAAEALVALIEAELQPGRVRRVALVGARAQSLADYLQALRASLGLRRARAVSMPAPLVSLAAKLGDRWPNAMLLDSAAWRMLRRGSVADAQDTARLLGRAPREPRDFVDPAERETVRRQSQLTWLLPVLRGSLAALWIATAIVSAALYPLADSFALLAQAGVPAALRPAALYGAAAADLAMGVLSLWPFRGRRWLWAAQAALIAVYTLIISATMPAFWLHPFGPLTKNLPLLALLWLLWAMEPARAAPRED